MGMFHGQRAFARGRTRATVVSQANRELCGVASRGPYSHSDAAYYISLVILHTKYNKLRLNGPTAHLG